MKCVLHMISYLDEFRNRNTLQDRTLQPPGTKLLLNSFFLRLDSSTCSFDRLGAANFYEIVITASDPETGI